MTDVIDIPASAQAALDGGAMYTLAAVLTLPAAQSADGAGAPWRFVRWPDAITYAGQRFDAADSPLIRSAWSTAKQDSEGHAALELLDPRGVWEGRFVAAGVQGNPVTVLHLLPHGLGEWWPMDTFPAETVSVEPLFDPSLGRVLRVLLEDQIYRAKLTPGEWTTDAHQRKLSAAAGQDPPDNSHIVAAVARTKRWHTR